MTCAFAFKLSRDLYIAASSHRLLRVDFNLSYPIWANGKLFYFKISWTFPFDVNEVKVRRSGKICGAVFTSWVEWNREESEKASFLSKIPSNNLLQSHLYRNTSWKIVKTVKIYGKIDPNQNIFCKLYALCKSNKARVYIMLKLKRH